MKLVYKVGKVWEFDSLSANTIALGGAVKCSCVDTIQSMYSFNHYIGDLSFVERAVCEQVLDELVFGMDPRNCVILVNDVSASGVLSYWLLENWVNLGDAERGKIGNEVVEVGASDSRGSTYKDSSPLYKALTPDFKELKTEELFREKLVILDNWFETMLLLE